MLVWYFEPMLLTSLLVATAIAAPQKAVVEDLIVGSGMHVEKGDVVNLGFRCTYLDGRILDSTFGKAPFCIKVGWRPRLDSFARMPFSAFDIALVGMKEGGRRRIELPSALAFGELELGDVPPNTNLTIEVEVLGVTKKGATPPIKIEDIEIGKGATVAEGQNLGIHYRGSFLNGVEFESTMREFGPDGKPTNAPMPFEYGSRPMIKGFLDGIKGMRVGGIRKVSIPYYLAYGDKGSREIPPYATLVFELRVVSAK